MFTKPEQQETFRFSNDLGLSFSLSCYSFGRAPPHSLPPAPSRCTPAPRPTDSESRAERLGGSGLLLCPSKSARSRGRAGFISLGFRIPLSSRERRAGRGGCCSLAPLRNAGQGTRGVPARQHLEPWEHCTCVQHLALSAGEIPPCVAARRARSCPMRQHPSVSSPELPASRRSTTPSTLPAHSASRSVGRGWFVRTFWSGHSKSHPAPRLTAQDPLGGLIPPLTDLGPGTLIQRAPVLTK